MDMRNDNRSPDELQRDIDRLRDRIRTSVDTLETRLSPSTLVDQAFGAIREHGGETATNFGRTVKQNPVALTLVGAGLLWLMKGQGPRPPVGQVDPYTGRYSGDESSSPGIADRARSAMDSLKDSVAQAKDRAESAVDSLRHSAADAKGSMEARAQSMSDSASSGVDRMRSGMSQLSDSAGSLSRSAQRTASQTRDRFGRLIDEQPFLVGAIGLAIGAAVGSLVPMSRRENELMGSARDDLMRKASDMAGEKLEQAREAVQESVSRDGAQGRVAGAPQSPTSEASGRFGSDDGRFASAGSVSSDRSSAMATEAGAGRAGHLPAPRPGQAAGSEGDATKPPGAPLGADTGSSVRGTIPPR